MDSVTQPDLAAILHHQRQAQAPNGPDYHQRKAHLLALSRILTQYREPLIKAIAADFGNRAPQETMLGDLLIVREEIKHILKHFRVWMRPRPADVDWKFLPAQAWVQHQPVGVVGVISPWNYPVNLALAPLAAALAAGNRVMLKPSELTPHTAEMLKRMLAEVFAEDHVAVVIGDADVAARFSSLPFDHLFFTGSTAIGRKVMAAAAENLTPVTLELGGKSPALVTPDYPLNIAAQRLVAGKLFNAGQTCIAPDYVLLAGGDSASFVNQIRVAFEQAYPGFEANNDYTSIISERHYQRLQNLLREARVGGAEIVRLADVDDDSAQRRLTPAIVLNPPEDCALMREEIFGPILPVVSVNSTQAAIDYVNHRPRPLALYYFGARGSEQVLEQTISGGVCINDTLLHIAQTDLPFGGAGESGMGQYHGYDGFLTFTQKKAVMKQSRFNTAGLLRPPYSQWKDKVLALLSR